MKRYAAKLLFQFRAIVHGRPNKRRLCEERVILFQAPSGRQALRLAKRKGHRSQHNYRSDNGRVYFEFVGVLELLSLDPACEPDEVWYDLVKHVLPMERRQVLIPTESSLEAIRNEGME
jgi:hypothetical protein